jgi:hypothetical protein
MFKIIRSRETSEIHGDNLNNVRSKVSGHFGNKKREYMRESINELSEMYIEE